jgi:hypothetical protein
LGTPGGVWARGVINPGNLVIEVLMQKNTISPFSQGLLPTSPVNILRYTSKLMIYGFLDFFCVLDFLEGGPPESRARKG